MHDVKSLDITFVKHISFQGYSNMNHSDNGPTRLTHHQPPVFVRLTSRLVLRPPFLPMGFHPGRATLGRMGMFELEVREIGEAFLDKTFNRPTPP